MRTLEEVARYWQARARSGLLPCRVILGEHGVLLSRYTVRELESGGRLYLHHFHRSDADDDLHNHPWSGSSTILAGGYTEERLHPDGSIRSRTYLPGDSVDLMPNTFHRVDLLDPAAGCWTLFRTSRRVQSWGFIDHARARRSRPGVRRAGRGVV